MRSFSNILPNFATNLHLLVDSIDLRKHDFFIKNKLIDTLRIIGFKNKV